MTIVDLGAQSVTSLTMVGKVSGVRNPLSARSWKIPLLLAAPREIS